MLTKQEKERLANAEKLNWKDEKMVKYIVDKTMLLFELRGNIVPIEKKSVKTHFCFGYSCHVPDDFENANHMAAYAQKNEMYFLRENHRDAGYARTIDLINDGRYQAVAYRNKRNPEAPMSINMRNRYDIEVKGIPDNAFILTEEEVQAYKRKLAEACVLHQKKLAAYLKRYGLSKVESWSYWQDE